MKLCINSEVARMYGEEIKIQSYRLKFNIFLQHTARKHGGNFLIWSIARYPMHSHTYLGFFFYLQNIHGVTIPNSGVS